MSFFVHSHFFTPGVLKNYNVHPDLNLNDKKQNIHQVLQTVDISGRALDNVCDSNSALAVFLLQSRR